jgi:hypothetical protein
VRIRGSDFEAFIAGEMRAVADSDLEYAQQWDEARAAAKAATAAVRIRDKALRVAVDALTEAAKQLPG